MSARHQFVSGLLEYVCASDRSFEVVFGQDVILRTRDGPRVIAGDDRRGAEWVEYASVDTVGITSGNVDDFRRFASRVADSYDGSVGDRSSEGGDGNRGPGEERLGGSQVLGSDIGVAAAGSHGASGGDVCRHISGCGCGAATVREPAMGSSQVSAKTLANRAKRQRRKEQRKVAAASRASESLDWRSRDAKAMVHRSVFADCSASVQQELRETRAKMLVEKNKTAVVAAECERRRFEARLKCQVVEREVEALRLKLECDNRKLMEQKMKNMPAGFAETVVSEGLDSVFTVPTSVSSDSISPNSSVSVELVVKMEATIAKMAERLEKLEVENVKLKNGNDGEREQVLVSAGHKRTNSSVVVPSATGVVKPEVVASDLGFSRPNGATVVSGFRTSLSWEEQQRRSALGLPVTGPGSGVGGYGRWD